MRELTAKEITENVAEMCKEAAYYLPDDVYEGLKKGRETEESPVGQVVLDQIITRADDRSRNQNTVARLELTGHFLRKRSGNTDTFRH